MPTKKVIVNPGLPTETQLPIEATAIDRELENFQIHLGILIRAGVSLQVAEWTDNGVPGILIILDNCKLATLPDGGRRIVKA